MALWVSTYVNLLPRGLWAGRHVGASDRLPPVLPVVLCNGASLWTAAASLEELLAQEGRPSGSAGPVPVYAGSACMTLDLGRVWGRRLLA